MSEQKNNTPAMDIEANLTLAQNAGEYSALRGCLDKHMVPVPGFRPRHVRQNGANPIPASCSLEDSNLYRSAGALLEALATEARAWSTQLPAQFRPAIVALLHGGVQVQVRSLAQVSFDGIRIEGWMGDRPCSLLAHQNTVQLVCHAIQVENTEDAAAKYPIGFIWPDRDEEI